MTRRLTEFKNLIKVTIWIDKEQWARFGAVMGDGQRSDTIRNFVDRVVGKKSQ